MSIVYSTDGRIIGEIDGGVFYKQVIPKIHRLRKPPAWATDADSFDREVAPNCHAIVLIDKENDKQFTTSIDAFIAHRFEFNRGFGRQYAVTLRWWTELNPAQKRML